ncbi:MAG: hypothetical protein KatS3mg087_1754 [Patescibacteria group bacterium]|nr:MAG: hypothetical protein KatS3mg087_1754 [Patescibacteria group bacterium]
MGAWKRVPNTVNVPELVGVVKSSIDLSRSQYLVGTVLLKSGSFPYSKERYSRCPFQKTRNGSVNCVLTIRVFALTLIFSSWTMDCVICEALNAAWERKLRQSWGDGFGIGT